jgi:hypothetical protein
VETVEFLDRQNKDMASHEWFIVRDSDSGDVTSANFSALIGDQPLEETKALNFKPNC